MCVGFVKVGVEHKALGNYMGNIRWLLEYIYIYICIDSSDSQHYFFSKLNFLYNSTLFFVTTPTIVR
jgi:hypothetical protein